MSERLFRSFHNSLAAIVVISLQACGNVEQTAPASADLPSSREIQVPPQAPVELRTPTPIDPSVGAAVVIRRKGRDGRERVRRIHVSVDDLVREIEALALKERRLAYGAGSSPSFQLANWTPSSAATASGTHIDTTETVDGIVMRILASPFGSNDLMELRLDGVTFSQSLVQYDFSGGLATASSMAGVNYIPSLDFTGEVYLGSAAIEAYGGHSLEGDEYEFLEIAQSSACVSAVIGYAGAYGLLLYEIAGARKPSKLAGIFGRVSIRIGLVIGAALAIDAACNDEDEM